MMAFSMKGSSCMFAKAFVKSTSAATSLAPALVAGSRSYVVRKLSSAPIISGSNGIDIDTRAEHIQKVEACYSYYEDVSNLINISDYTDGMYFGDRNVCYDKAQDNQTQYLLNQAHVGPGTRLLDVGCGRGRLLQAAKERGAECVGISISPEQVSYCSNLGLDVRLQDYMTMDPTEWYGQFDAVVSNGSMEHFVSPQQGLERRAGPIYEETFEIFRKLMNPTSANRRLVTTVIHHRPRNGKRLCLSFTNKIMFGLLAEAYGGWYPLDGQLESCASGNFRAIEKQDGTQDYLWTSIDGFNALRAKQYEEFGKFAHLLLKTGVSRAPLFLINPWLWTWQFQGKEPPTVLWRHTWECIHPDGSSK